ncbi:hypothetical protein D3C75_1219110 [compost metagenome]
MFRCEFDRIIQQIQPDLIEHLFVAGQGIIMKTQIEGEMFFLHLGCQQQHALADLLSDVNLLLVRQNRLGLDLRQLQHI